MSEDSTSTHRTRAVFLIRDLGFGGAQRQLAELCAGLDRAKFEVTVVTFYSGPLGEELITRGVRVITVGKSGRWDMIGFLVRMVSTLRTLQPEVLYTFLTESNLLGAILKPFIGRTRLIWGLRDSQTDAAHYGWLGSLAFWLASRLSSRADTFIANSHAGAAYYTSLGYSESKMRIVPNGIDTERFQPRPLNTLLRGQWAIPSGAFVFGLIGRISPMKDHATALRALASLPAHCHLVVMGKGDDQIATDLRRLCAELGIQSRVRWAEPSTDMPAVYAALDAIVSSSSFGEGFSNVIGEAMACGLPCAATDVGDSASLVGRAELISPPRNFEALSAAMLHVVANRDSLTTASRDRIRGQFSIPQMVDATSKVMEDVSRIPIAIYTTGLGSGGAEMMLVQLSHGLSGAGFAPHVISLSRGGKHTTSLQELGIPVHSLEMEPGRPSFSALLRLRRLARTIRPEINVGWMYHGNLAATLARFIGHRAPVIWNVRQSLYDLALEKRGSAMIIRLLARLSRVPHSIIYNSRLSAAQHEKAGYLPARTRLMPNGFNTNLFKPDPQARLKLREELKLPTDALLIGRIGRNAAMKDYPSFLEAARMLAQQLPEARFVIAGAETDSLPAQENVIVLGERNDLPELTAALDVAVSSSAFGEGFPNVVAEAMACAVPVVATDIGDTTWVMGDTGNVVPARSPQALADAIALLARLSPSQRAILGAAGRERILQHFTLEAAVLHFREAILQSLHPQFIPQHPSTQPCAA